MKTLLVFTLFVVMDDLACFKSYKRCIMNNPNFVNVRLVSKKEYLFVCKLHYVMTHDVKWGEHLFELRQS